MPVTKEGRWVQLRVSFQLRPSLFCHFHHHCDQCFGPCRMFNGGTRIPCFGLCFFSRFQVCFCFSVKGCLGCMVLCASRAFFFRLYGRGLSKGRVRMVKRRNLCCVHTLWNVKVHQRGQTSGEREGGERVTTFCVRRLKEIFGGGFLW